jgi:riboflavin biosynthesis pyrimidine reductase
VHAVDVAFRTLLAPDLATSAEERVPRAPTGQISLGALLDSLSFPHLPTRPYVLLNMISTVDGRATIGGRSGPLGGRADHDLFHGLRTLVDGVLVGAQTLRTERYNRIVADAPSRTRRLARGLGEEPLACIVSTSLALDPTIPLLADGGAHVAILTPSEGELVPVAARVAYVRAVRDGRLDLAAALGTLRRRFAVRTLLCEGGPHLAGQLIAAELLDELFLTTSPKLVSGEVESDPASALPAARAGPALSILSGPEFDPPVAVELHSLLESESYLFARYRVLR